MAPTQHVSSDIQPLEEEGGGVYARQDPFREKLTKIRSALNEKKVKELDGDVNDAEMATLDPRDLSHKQVWTRTEVEKSLYDAIYRDGIDPEPLRCFSNFADKL
jgi:hypothetical protein